MSQRSRSKNASRYKKDTVCRDTDGIQNITMKEINKDFSRSRYDKFKIITMNNNGYINATVLCINYGKNVVTWNRFTHVKELKNDIGLILGTSKPVISISIGHDQRLQIITGIYIHPSLLPHITSWISPTFAIKVAHIINKYHIKESLYEKSVSLKKINNNAHSLLQENREQTRTIERLLLANKKQNTRVRKLNGKLDNLTHTAAELIEQKNRLIFKVNTVSEDRVIKSKYITNKPVFVLLKDNTIKDSMRYYVIRTKRRFLNRALARYKQSHPEGKILLKIDYNPNSINLWDRIKEKLNKKIIVNMNNVGLQVGYSEKRFLRNIKSINKERYK